MFEDFYCAAEDIDPDDVETEDIGQDNITDTVKSILLGGKDYSVTYELSVQRRIQQDLLPAMRSWVHSLSSTDALIPRKGSKAQQKKEDQWSMGLTGKSSKNIPDLAAFAVDLQRTAAAQADENEQVSPLSGELHFEGETIPLTHGNLLELQRLIGPRASSIRGSAKSRFGKKCERPILGAVAELLGFTYAEKPTLAKGTFSFNVSIGRECDMFLYIGDKKGVVFDVTLAKRGNSEVPNDKMMRFARTTNINGKSIALVTCIITHELTKGRKKPGLIQMVDPLWIQQVAQYIYDECSYDHLIRSMSPSNLVDYIRENVVDVTKWTR